jgi:trigger factor
VTIATTSDLIVDVDRKPGSIVEIRVEAPAGELDRALQSATRRLGSRLRIPGFRPGKAPAAMIERMVGWDALRQEAAEELIPSLYSRALDQAGIEPVDDPKLSLENVERGQPVKFTAAVTVRPEVDLGDYMEMRVEEERTEVTEARVDEALEEVRRRHSELVQVDRPAQSGDVLRCVLVMRRGDEILSGADGEEREVELDRERLIPGLVDALVGLEAGAERSFPLTLPQDYPQEELRGVTAQVAARIVSVQERKLPELDDDLAKRDGNAESLDAMRQHYRALLEAAAVRDDAEAYEAAVLTAVRDRIRVDVPEAMAERELDRQVAEMEIRLAGMGMQFERYLEYTGSSVDKFRLERREVAGQRVRLELALDALAQAEQLEVDESQVEREEERIAAGRKLSAEQRRRVHAGAHIDLLRRAASERAKEIARGEG